MAKAATDKEQDPLAWLDAAPEDVQAVKLFLKDGSAHYIDLEQRRDQAQDNAG